MALIAIFWSNKSWTRYIRNILKQKQFNDDIFFIFEDFDVNIVHFSIKKMIKLSFCTKSARIFHIVIRTPSLTLG